MVGRQTTESAGLLTRTIHSPATFIIAFLNEHFIAISFSFFNFRAQRPGRLAYWNNTRAFAGVIHLDPVPFIDDIGNFATAISPTPFSK